jgi:hypothetical protein
VSITTANIEQSFRMIFLLLRVDAPHHNYLGNINIAPYYIKYESSNYVTYMDCGDILVGKCFP